MPVQYVRVRSQVDMFTPLSRPTGVVAILGAGTKGVENRPVQVTTPSEAAEEFGDALNIPADPTQEPTLSSALTSALDTALRQTPGPSQVWGLHTTNIEEGLRVLETLPVNFVVLANTPLNGTNAGVIGQLLTHVTSVSNAGDGNERMGVVMLPAGTSSPAAVSGDLVNDRMVYIAHRCKENAGDPAAAVAGTIAGYPPHVSMLLKPVTITSPPFTNTQINELNDPEEFGKPPQGNGVNWLARPALIPGQGTYLGEGYTGNPGGMKYVDVVRTVDDITFKLKARLINAIGDVRMNRPGLRTLALQVEAELSQLVADGVIDSSDVTIPVLDLLELDPATLTDLQLQRIKNAQDARLAQILVSVDYNGAVHRIDLDFTLK